MNRLFIAIVAGTLAASAQASYLFWQVYTEGTGAASINQYATDNGVGYAHLRSFATDGGKVDFSSNPDVSGVNGGSIAAIGGPSDFSSAIQVELVQGNSYYIELLAYNSASQTYIGVGMSEVMTYEQLVKKGYAYENADLTDIPKLNLQIWNGGAYSVPEPTGSLMMVLGLAFLGLKRRTA